MKIASPKLDTSHLSLNEETLFRCQTALEQKDREDYEGGQETIRPLWRGVGERPERAELGVPVAAEVLLCSGILTGWIGSKNQIKGAQESAKNLITESSTFLSQLAIRRWLQSRRWSFAFCYWREGALNEARIMLREALKTLTMEGSTRARALLKFTTVECSAARYHEALQILNDNAPLFQRIPNHTVRGAYHAELAIILQNLATQRRKGSIFGKQSRNMKRLIPTGR